MARYVLAFLLVVLTSSVASAQTYSGTLAAFGDSVPFVLYPKQGKSFSGGGVGMQQPRTTPNGDPGSSGIVIASVAELPDRPTIAVGPCVELVINYSRSGQAGGLNAVYRTSPPIGGTLTLDLIRGDVLLFPGSITLIP